jgi:hypothetical protein
MHGGAHADNCVVEYKHLPPVRIKAFRQAAGDIMNQREMRDQAW